MPRRPPVGLLAAVLAATSCAGSPDSPPSAVPVTPVSGLIAQVRAVCASVTDALPHTVAAGVVRRDTLPSDPTVAAWGDPAVVLRCGVPSGSARDDPYEFDGVRWAMHDTGGTRTWTTFQRPVNVEVVIPDAYDGQAELLGGLATALSPTG